MNGNSRNLRLILICPTMYSIFSQGSILVVIATIGFLLNSLELYFLIFRIRLPANQVRYLRKETNSQSVCLLEPDTKYLQIMFQI